MHSSNITSPFQVSQPSFPSLEIIGDDATTDGELVGSYCIDRKIDLTSYIKWWAPNKTRQTDPNTKSSDESKYSCAEDISSELKAFDWAMQPTEPYQMPHLGISREGKRLKGSTSSALSILSRSAAYKSLQVKALKKKEAVIENDENENKNSINKIEYGKAVEKSSHDGGSERLGVTLGMSGGPSFQRNLYPLAPFLTAPLMTNYSTVDPLTDPILWASLLPNLPGGSSRIPEVGSFSHTVNFHKLLIHANDMVVFSDLRTPNQYFYSTCRPFLKNGI